MWFQYWLYNCLLVTIVLTENVVMLLQLDKIAEHGKSQSWDGLEVVADLPGRGRGVKVTRPFQLGEVVCDYTGELLSHKAGKAKFEMTPENAMGFMYEFKYLGTSYWRDATEELPGPGRIINHSKCHANVSTRQFVCRCQTGSLQTAIALQTDNYSSIEQFSVHCICELNYYYCFSSVNCGKR